MKKKILALACVMTLVIGMSLTVCAEEGNGSNSAGAGDVIPGGSDSAGAGDVIPDDNKDTETSTGNQNTGTSTGSQNTGTSSGNQSSGTSSNSTNAETPSTTMQNDPQERISITNGTGQVLTGANLAEFARTTGISGVAGAKLGVVSNEVAKNMITEANRVVGSNAFIATIVDLQVPEGTGTATFTLTCPNVWSGQTVRILHLKADGTFETIIPSSVANNAVTFTMTSYSPIALVIDTTAPKTADTGLAAGLLIVVLAMAGAVASAAYGRKVKE